MKTQTTPKTEAALSYLRFLASESGVSVRELIDEVQALAEKSDEDSDFYQAAAHHAQREFGDDEVEYSLEDAKEVL